jgi:hypothetical protein
VVERARLPLEIVVTVFATLFSGYHGELAGMNVLVAPCAYQRSILEYKLAHTGRESGGAVTVLAGPTPVRPSERKTSLGVIEARHLLPHPNGMTDLASQSGPRIGRGLPASQLWLMRVLVTSGTSEIGELVRHRTMETRPDLVAIAAGHGQVRTLQREAGFIVARQSELRGLEALHGVALFTAVPVHRVRKLPLVRIMVAVHAFPIPNPIEGGPTSRLVALAAGHGGMLAEQWIRALGVGLHVVGGSLPAIG